MIRISFLIIGLLSLIYGILFLIFPYWFVEFSLALPTNIAWLRTIGASLIGLLFFGSIFIYIEPKNKLSLLSTVTFTSILQTLGLLYSRFNNEFSAKNLFIIDLTIYVALLVTIYLIILNTYKYKFFI